MAFYIFYPCRTDGRSESFVIHEFADDAAALDHAGNVLREHRSAAYVTVYCDERHVGTHPQLKPFAARSLFDEA